MIAPKRWVAAGSEVDPVVRSLLGYAKSRVPSEVEVERLARRVSERFEEPRLRLAVWRSRLRTALSFAVAVACGGLAWAVSGRVLNVLVAPEPASRPAEPALPSRPAAKPRAVAHVLPPAEAATEPELAPSSEPATPQPVTAKPVPPAAKPGPATAKPVPSVARAQASSVSAAQAADDLVTLADARRVLASDPARAFALTTASEQVSPRSQFGEERTAIAIEALERLGRLTEAEQRLDAFERRFPSSPYRRRLRAGLEKR